MYVPSKCPKCGEQGLVRMWRITEDDGWLEVACDCGWTRDYRVEYEEEDGTGEVGEAQS